MIDNIILNKVEIINRCLQRIDAEFIGYEDEFDTNYTKQDSILLNIQRACEACIDLGSYLVRIKKLGLPQSSRDVFVLLEKAGLITLSLSKNLHSMVGFRNLAIVESIITNQKRDFLSFTKICLDFQQYQG